MKIKDITEGLYDYVTNFGQKKQQANWTHSSGDKQAYMSQYEKDIDQANRDYRTATTPVSGPESATTVANPKEGSVLLVSAPNGNTYFKTYTGSWHLRGKSATDYSVGGTKITATKDIDALDRLLPNAKVIGVKLDPRNPTGNAWVYDQRKTALLAKRSGKK